MIVVAILTIGDRAAFDRFEAHAEAAMARHGAAIERRIAIDAPAREVHVVSFPDARAWEAYRADPELRELASLRAQGILATEILVGEDVGGCR